MALKNKQEVALRNTEWPEDTVLGHIGSPIWKTPAYGPCFRPLSSTLIGLHATQDSAQKIRDVDISSEINRRAEVAIKGSFRNR